MPPIRRRPRRAGGPRPGAAPDAGGGAVDSRRTSSVGRTSRRGRSPASWRSANAKPRRPISCSGSRTVERLGAVIAAVWMSSKPATETSPGTVMPSSASRSSAPSASRSLAAQIAVNGAAPASSVSTPSAPPSRLNPVLHDQALVERDARLGEARAGSPPVAGARRTATSARRGTRSADGRAGRARRPSRRCRRRCRRRPPARPRRAARGGRRPRRRRASRRGACASPR